MVAPARPLSRSPSLSLAPSRFLAIRRHTHTHTHTFAQSVSRSPPFRRCIHYSLWLTLRAAYTALPSVLYCTVACLPFKTFVHVCVYCKPDFASTSIRVLIGPLQVKRVTIITNHWSIIRNVYLIFFRILNPYFVPSSTSALLSSINAGPVRFSILFAPCLQYVRSSCDNSDTPPSTASV